VGTPENFPDSQKLSFSNDGVLLLLGEFNFFVKGDDVSHGLPTVFV
jgi:hypothetical protein